MIFSIFKGDAVDIEKNIGSVTRRDVTVGRASNKGARKGVGCMVSERGPCNVQRRAPAWRALRVGLVLGRDLL